MKPKVPGAKRKNSKTFPPSSARRAPGLPALAARLREFRHGAGLTQKKLGELSGVHPVQIANYEKGHHKPYPKTLEKLLRALGALPGDGDEPYMGGVYTREEFFKQLEKKMTEAVHPMFKRFVLARLCRSAEFFTREKFFPGDFSEAVRHLGRMVDLERVGKVKVIPASWIDPHPETGPVIGGKRRKRRPRAHRIIRFEKTE